MQGSQFDLSEKGKSSHIYLFDQKAKVTRRAWDLTQNDKYSKLYMYREFFYFS